MIQFITINAAERGGAALLPAARVLLDSARFYHERGRWFLHLLLLMPDHMHLLASFPEDGCVAVCGAWKRYASRTFGLSFQANMFDCRIRDARDYAEKWEYILANPVRKGLVAAADEWPWWMAFDPLTGRARSPNAP